MKLSFGRLLGRLSVMLQLDGGSEMELREGWHLEGGHRAAFSGRGQGSRDGAILKPAAIRMARGQEAARRAKEHDRKKKGQEQEEHSETAFVSPVACKSLGASRISEVSAISTFSSSLLAGLSLAPVAGEVRPRHTVADGPAPLWREDGRAGEGGPSCPSGRWPP